MISTRISLIRSTTTTGFVTTFPPVATIPAGFLSVGPPPFALNSNNHANPNNTNNSIDDNLFQLHNSSVLFPGNLTHILLLNDTNNRVENTSMIFCILIMFLGVIGNVMVPIVIFKSKDMRNSTNIFLVNLSAADLMVLLVCTPTVLVEVNSRPETWVLGREMCKFCTFSSPILGIADYKYVEYFDGSKVPACHTLANTFWSALYFLGSIFLFFMTPFLILIILYCIIARHLFSAKQSGFPAAAMSSPTQNHRTAAVQMLSQRTDSYSLRARRQVILMLGTVVLSFFLCLIPFRVFTLWIIIVPAERVNHLEIDKYYNILYFCRIMVYLNSALNPILYNLMSSKFRRGFLICSLKSRRFRTRSARNTNTSSYTTTNSYRSSISMRHLYDTATADSVAAARKTRVAVEPTQKRTSSKRQSSTEKTVVQQPSSTDTTENHNHCTTRKFLFQSINCKDRKEHDESYL